MAYLLTVSRMDMSVRRRHWADPSYDPGVRLIGSRQMPVAYFGALVLVGDGGTIRRGIPLVSPKGMLRVDDRLLVACHTEIRSFSANLDSSCSLVSAPWCNDLHSLRPSPGGFLVASTGADAAAELAPDGTELWRWWAVDHGFPLDQRSEPWSLGKDTDHRNYVYPVDLQSIHLNAVAALDRDTLVATLLHRDALIAIDWATGAQRTLGDPVRQPHAVRVLDEGMITYCDTKTGEGTLARVEGDQLTVVQRVAAGTDWLQDATFDGDSWTLVDGANARVVHADRDGKVVRVDTFDPEWCLYETLPWPQG